jgi:hypothetical protein
MTREGLLCVPIMLLTAAAGVVPLVVLGCGDEVIAAVAVQLALYEWPLHAGPSAQLQRTLVESGKDKGLQKTLGQTFGARGSVASGLHQATSLCDKMLTASL